MDGVNILISVIHRVFWDTQTYITVKENIMSKIVAPLNRIADSYTMRALQAILA